jgi:hypothetical protein
VTGKADLAASVAARLLNRAKETGDDHQTLLTSYCLERFLYRLGASDRRDRFVLKGAMLLRRRTPIPAEDPIGLTRLYWENPSRPAQVRAFARRARLAVPEKPEEEFTRLLHAFLAPVLEDLRVGTARKGTWRPGGPWR